MKKGVKRIILGSILIALQVVSFIGNTLAGTSSIQISFDSPALFVYDLVFLISYFFVGIVGLILLISGIVAHYKKNSIKKETEPVAPEIKAENKKPSNSRILKKAALIGVSCVVVIVLVIFGIYHLSNSQPVSEPKDAEYLYDWLTEHGTLVGGTCLQYSSTDESGIKFTLCYDTVLGNSFYVNYATKDNYGRTITTKLFLFADGKEAYSHISVYGIGKYSDYYRSLEYSHNPAIFTKNSPIERGELSGSTVHVPDSEKALVKEILELNTICEDLAQKNLCAILDWMKESFCQTSNMTMTDFGYNNY